MYDLYDEYDVFLYVKYDMYYQKDGLKSAFLAAKSYAEN